jgi:hypothetical protein
LKNKNKKMRVNNRLELTKPAVTHICDTLCSFIPKRKWRAGFTLGASASRARLRAVFAAQPGVISA